MRNFFGMFNSNSETAKSSQKEKLPSGLGRQPGLPSEKGTYIPYDSFGEDGDLKLEPTDNLSSHLRASLSKGEYVPRKVLQGQLSDERVSKIISAQKSFEEKLDDYIDRPQDQEEEEVIIPEESEAYSDKAEGGKMEQIGEQQKQDYDQEIEPDKIFADQAAGGSTLEDDKLPSKQSMGRSPIINGGGYSPRFDHQETHKSDKITKAQVGRQLNKKLGKKVQEYMQEKHNQGAAEEIEDNEEGADIYGGPRNRSRL
jgi:hypothetical protein